MPSIVDSKPKPPIPNPTIPINSELEKLLPELVSAAQKIYDNWDQDENGLDPELGSGGICDQITQEWAGILSLQGWDSTEGGQEGDDHSFLYIRKSEDSHEAYGIDIPTHIYESGGGYSWKKIPSVIFQPHHINIWPENPKNCFDELHHR